MGFYGPKRQCLASWEAFEKTAVNKDADCASMCTETRMSLLKKRLGSHTSLQPVCVSFQLEHIQNYFNMNSYCYLYSYRANETALECPPDVRAYEYGCGQTNGDFHFVGDRWIDDGCHCKCDENYRKMCNCAPPAVDLGTLDVHSEMDITNLLISTSACPDDFPPDLGKIQLNIAQGHIVIPDVYDYPMTEGECFHDHYQSRWIYTSGSKTGTDLFSLQQITYTLLILPTPVIINTTDAPSSREGSVLPFGFKYDDLYDYRVALFFSTLLFFLVMCLIELFLRKCCWNKRRKSNEMAEPLTMEHIRRYNEQYGGSTRRSQPRPRYDSEDGEDHSPCARSESSNTHASYPSEQGPPFFLRTREPSPYLPRAFSVPPHVGAPPSMPPKPFESVRIPEITIDDEETPDDYLDGWANKLKLVAELYSKGLLTEEEFNLAKEKLLRK